MFPSGRESECESVLRFVAETVTGRQNKLLAVVGNCGCGKTSSVMAVMRALETPEGVAMYQRLAAEPAPSTRGVAATCGRSRAGATPAAPPQAQQPDGESLAASTQRLPRFEYINCADVAPKALLWTMAERVRRLAPHPSPSSSSGTTAAAAAAAAKARRAADSAIEAAMRRTIADLTDNFGKALVEQADVSCGAAAAGRKTAAGARSAASRARPPPLLARDSNAAQAAATSGPSGRHQSQAPPPFCVLVLDEVAAAGKGWRGQLFSHVVSAALDVRSVGLIGVSNAMDLRELAPKCAAYLKFDAYQGPALAAIAQQRVAGTAFHPLAVALAAKSVAANQCGDARKVIDLCRTTAAAKQSRDAAAASAAAAAAAAAASAAAAVAVAAPLSQRGRRAVAKSSAAAAAAGADSDAAEAATQAQAQAKRTREQTEVTLNDVAAAIRASTTHPVAQMLSGLPPLHLHALCCVVNYVKNATAASASMQSGARHGVVWFTKEPIHAMYARLAQHLSCPVVSTNIFRDALGGLRDNGFLSGNDHRFSLLLHSSELESALQQRGDMYSIADKIVKSELVARNNSGSIASAYGRHHY